MQLCLASCVPGWKSANFFGWMLLSGTIVLTQSPMEWPNRALTWHVRGVFRGYDAMPFRKRGVQPLR
jgi:hypothetical protein